MSISDDKMRVVVIVEKDLVACLDKIGSELGISRSQMIVGCIESGLDDLRFLSFLGLTPRRLAAVGKALKRLGVVKSGDVKVDVSHVPESV